ncbi:peptidase C1 [Hymenobacter gummosus]|uniref:N-acetylmuramoyl-L-alanine amidase n=1 Tax=Hymenobacter gummosus TaxID=1776032 RepID=A0A3S0H1S3_9BACT|nr:N-acetylmuramoyl-L-alanine amidase [Hymenobacter gummosus]RTQ44868.1 peptidase C1 [Hymenobacter gummosus]
MPPTPTLPERLNLKTDFISPGAGNRSGRALTLTHITIHNTSNADRGADALMHARYVKGADAVKRRVSWHFSVDDKRCVQHLPLTEQGMHAGSSLGNARSLGIEICENAGIDQAAANQRAALLAAALLQRFGLPLERVVPHKHWSGKQCPHLLLDAKGTIGGFLKLVKAELAKLPAALPPALADGRAGTGPALALAADATAAVTPAMTRAAAPTDQLFALDAEGTSSDTVRANRVISLAGKGKATGPSYVLNARPDSLDFRDALFVPTLREVPATRSLEEYQHLAQQCGVPVLDQGREGACTGFALATVANYLLGQRARPCQPVSARMLYEMARRYDEWEGEDYEGSSARGAIKGWHKHGVCTEQAWPSLGPNGHRLTGELAQAAGRCPLGAYFRVNHKDLVSMHNALAEVGILYATGIVHEGWQRVGADGRIELGDTRLGGHAFAIVGYDEEGFWLQNSWGDTWGRQGFAHLSYDDWLANGTDVWVVRLGVPVQLRTAQAVAAARWNGAVKANSYSFPDLRPHVISLGNDGGLRRTGTFGNDEEEVRHLLLEEFPRITQGWQRKRLLIYAHGGLVAENDALQRVAEYRAELLKHEVYPLALIWKTDFWTTITNVLQDAQRRRRPEGFLDGALDFVLDRLDDFLEPVARHAGGRMLWQEMKENARLATEGPQGALPLVLELLQELGPEVELHVVGHSAGSIVLGPFLQLLTTAGRIGSGPLKGQQGYGRQVASCTLWAPAVTTELFLETYAPAIQNGSIGRTAVFALHDAVEQDDHCANIYHKSLLYLVSNAFEEATVRRPFPHDRGTPLLGMAKFLTGDFADADVAAMVKKGDVELVLAPEIRSSTAPDFKPERQSASRHHGDFDDDEPTVRATLARILGAGPALNALKAEPANKNLFRSNADSLQQLRQSLPNPVSNSR